MLEKGGKLYQRRKGSVEERNGEREAAGEESKWHQKEREQQRERKRFE